MTSPVLFDTNRFIQTVKCSFFSLIIVYQSFYGALLRFSYFFLQGKVLCLGMRRQVACEMVIVWRVPKTLPKKLYLRLYLTQIVHSNVSAYAYAYVRICIRVCAYMHTRMCVYAYAYVRISIRVYAYWADANYAYILVRIYLSCTVCSMKQLGVFLLSPGWDASPTQGCPHPPYTFGIPGCMERGTVRVKCVAQEHNTMIPARAWTQTTQSRV